MLIQWTIIVSPVVEPIVLKNVLLLLVWQWRRCIHLTILKEVRVVLVGVMLMVPSHLKISSLLLQTKLRKPRIVQAVQTLWQGQYHNSNQGKKQHYNQNQGYLEGFNQGFSNMSINNNTLPYGFQQNPRPTQPTLQKQSIAPLSNPKDVS